MDDVLRDYARKAAELAPRFEALQACAVLAPIRAHLPAPPARIANIGAGTGRDAAWLKTLGYRVTAIEPVAELAAYGRTTHGDGIEWHRDTLPGIHALRADGLRFDCILAVSVWHHLSAETSAVALRNLGEVVPPGGRLILSLKVFGDGRDTLSPETVLEQAGAAGWCLRAQPRATSQQDHNRWAGNMWDWLVLMQNNGEDRP